MDVAQCQSVRINQGLLGSTIFGINHIYLHRFQVPGTWKHRGPGEVIAIPSLRDSPCMRNCSERGAVCVAFDPEAAVKNCVCAESGLVLDFRNPHCDQGECNPPIQPRR